jgi:hypothetical protein
MMIFGMLYFDRSAEMSDVDLIGVARSAFERRTKEKATIALVNMGVDMLPEVEGLTIYPSYLVRPHHTIVGVPAQDHFLKDLPVLDS